MLLLLPFGIVGGAVVVAVAAAAAAATFGIVGGAVVVDVAAVSAVAGTVAAVAATAVVVVVAAAATAEHTPFLQARRSPRAQPPRRPPKPPTLIGSRYVNPLIIHYTHVFSDELLGIGLIRETRVIRTRHTHKKKLYIPVFLLSIFGPDCCPPPH